MSCPYTSPKNDKSKRIIYTTNDVVCSLLFQASLPTRYWVYNLHATTYIINLLSNKTILAPSLHVVLFITTSSYVHGPPVLRVHLLPKPLCHRSP
jgi:hypothetical protein